MRRHAARLLTRRHAGARGRLSASHPPDEGFTLVEMALAIAILGVIAVVLGSVIIVVLSNNGVGGTIATNARDEQIFATYFQRDVESSATVRTSDISVECPPSDSGIAGVGQVHPIAQLQYPPVHYSDGRSAVEIVDYYWQGLGSASSPARLYRRACNLMNGSTEPSPAFSDDALVRNLDVGGRRPVQFSVPASCPTCVKVTLAAVTLAADHQYSVTAEMRTPPTTTTTATTTTATSTTTTTEARGD